MDKYEIVSRVARCRECKEEMVLTAKLYTEGPLTLIAEGMVENEFQTQFEKHEKIHRDEDLAQLFKTGFLAHGSSEEEAESLGTTGVKVVTEILQKMFKEQDDKMWGPRPELPKQGGS